MYPVLFRIGDFAVTSFGVMMALAFLVGGWILSKELERKGDDPEIAWEVVWYAAIGGIVGARLYYMILTWPQTVADPWAALTSRGGLVWYGGFIGAALLIYWRLRKAELPVLRVADAVAPALAVAYAIGRMGCFLGGDDYGRPTDAELETLSRDVVRVERHSRRGKFLVKSKFNYANSAVQSSVVF